MAKVLVIGDTHCPFDLDGYLDFLKDTYKKYKCDTVVHIGDEVDNNFSSYHEADPDGYGGGDELDLAIERLGRYYKAFPKATVVLGNHSRLVKRKAFSGGIPKKWIREYNEVLEVPKWNFVDRVVIDDVQYIHGEGGTARRRAKDDQQSTVQGHLHTQAYVEWTVGNNQRIFGMQIGTGIDFDAYAFAYAKRGRKPAVSCGVVLNGETAIVEMMPLEKYKKNEKNKRAERKVKR